MQCTSVSMCWRTKSSSRRARRPCGLGSATQPPVEPSRMAWARSPISRWSSFSCSPSGPLPTRSSRGNSHCSSHWLCGWNASWTHRQARSTPGQPWQSRARASSDILAMASWWNWCHSARPSSQRASGAGQGTGVGIGRVSHGSASARPSASGSSGTGRCRGRPPCRRPWPGSPWRRRARCRRRRTPPAWWWPGFRPPRCSSTC